MYFHHRQMTCTFVATVPTKLRVEIPYGVSIFSSQLNIALFNTFLLLGFQLCNITS